MVEQNSTIEKMHNIVTEIEEETGKPNRQESLPSQKDVILFFAFDIVNSTAYKTVNYYGWAQILNTLFKKLRESVKNQINGAEMWRVLGDEAIFIVKIRSEEELREYINKIYKIMVNTIFKLKNGEFFKRENRQDNNFNLMKLQNILSLKTAAWIAAVHNIGDIDSGNKEINLEDEDSIFEIYHTQEGYEIFEFLGNDIDTGFRISTQVQDGRMVLSYELAYLISLQTESLSFLHIITYKRLKGIWKERLYPIIWYHNPKAYLDFYKKEISIEESFLFDDYIENNLIKEYYDNRNKDSNILQDTRMYSDSYYALSKILRDRGLDKKIEHLQDLIKHSTTDKTKYIDHLQLHCVAVCFNSDSENRIQILIAKRGGERDKFQGKWEFGCAKATAEKSIAEIIKEEYKKDFNIEIEPIVDNERSSQEPIPIALYQIDRLNTVKNEKNMDKGIITLAKIIEEYDPNNFKPNGKHQEVRWIKESDLPNLETELKDMVPDFKRTLQQAFEKIKTLDGL